VGGPSQPSGQTTPQGVTPSQPSAQAGPRTEPRVVTKGGLPVQPTPVLKKTPSTGPELIYLIGLIPSGAAGLFFRKKALA
jgi:hypothetical protein